MEKGKFIDLEGIDGSGTSTQSTLLVKYLFEKDKKNVIVLTREPTELNPYGKEVRRRIANKLLPGENVIHDPQYWADLFIFDREWHAANVLDPLVKIGLQIVCDRYDLSTDAYQSAQGMDMEKLIQEQEKLPSPNLTLLLDLSAEEALHRMGKDQQRTQEYFDNLDFQRKVRQNYLTAAQKLGATRNIVIINASKSIEDVAKAIQQEVNKLYGYK